MRELRPGRLIVQGCEWRLPTGNGINPRLDSGVRGSMKPKPRSSCQDLMVPSNRMGIVLLECSEAASRGLFVKY